METVINFLLLICLISVIAMVLLIKYNDCNTEVISNKSFVILVITTVIFIVTLFMSSNMIEYLPMFQDGIRVHSIVDRHGYEEGKLHEEGKLYLDNIDNYQTYDIIKYTKDVDDFTFIDCVKLLSEKYRCEEFFNNCKFIKNTGVLTVKGSDLKVVADIHKLYTPRGFYSYVESPYIRYNDIFYSLDVDSDDIDDSKLYLIEYALDSEGSIMDLTGEYTCYTDCRMYKSKY